MDSAPGHPSFSLSHDGSATTVQHLPQMCRRPRRGTRPRCDRSSPPTAARERNCGTRGPEPGADRPPPGRTSNGFLRKILGELATSPGFATVQPHVGRTETTSAADLPARCNLFAQTDQDRPRGTEQTRLWIAHLIPEIWRADLPAGAFVSCKILLPGERCCPDLDLA